MTYPIYKIPEEAVLEQEQLGTKDKFWIRGEVIDSNPDSEWLFKFPDEGTGQHWAEKIAYEIAKVMGLLVPRVELAELDGAKGTVTISFTKTHGYELYHGNQVLHGFDSNYEQDKRFRHKAHTVGKIFDAIGNTFADPKVSRRACYTMASYLVLDALICNVDRHHENWGILRKRKGEGWVGRLAPSFDHASSLGRELRDEHSKQNRARYLQELGVGKYIERGRSPIFMTGEEKHGLSPMKLVEACLHDEALSAYFRDGLGLLNSLNAEKFEQILSYLPDDWLSPLAKEFAFELLIETLKQLNDLQK